VTESAAPDAQALHRPREGALGRVQVVLDALNAVGAVLSSMALGAAALVLTWEVVGRYFLGIPSDWQDELSTFLLIGATFVSAGWTQARRGHVAIDALAHVLPPTVNRVRRVLVDACTAVFCGFFTGKCWQLLGEAISDGQISGSAWGAPLWIPYSCMTAGMALLTVQTIVQVLGGRGRRAGT
jgi:TRAP-type C4-dicarboxylate transport system permease small subunit